MMKKLILCLSLILSCSVLFAQNSQGLPKTSDELPCISYHLEGFKLSSPQKAAVEIGGHIKLEKSFILPSLPLASICSRSMMGKRRHDDKPFSLLGPSFEVNYSYLLSEESPK